MEPGPPGNVPSGHPADGSSHLSRTRVSQDPDRWIIDLIWAVSLANLLSVPLWQDLAKVRASALAYFSPSASNGHTLQLATVANVLLVGTLVFVVLRSLRYLPGKFASQARHCFQVAGLLFLFVRAFAPEMLSAIIGSSGARSFYAMLMQLLNLLGPGWTVAMVLLAGSVSIREFARHPHIPIKASRHVVLVLSPLVVINFVQVMWPVPARSETVQSRSATQPRPAHLHHAGRIVWLVFDELDQHLLFRGRPSGLQLAEFDRLRSESIYGTNAAAPARSTLASMPALISGEPVSAAEPVDSRTLELTLANGGKSIWNDHSSVFADAARMGFEPAIVGWYHPYCRIFRNAVACYAATSEAQGGRAAMWNSAAENLGFWPSLRIEALRTLELMPGIERFDGEASPELDVRLWQYMRLEQLERFQAIRKNTLQFLRRPELNFVFVHVPIPHPPGIFARRTGALSMGDSRNYVDNLVLADRFLGEIRSTLQELGEWDNTTVLVTSDHPFRAEVWERFPIWTAEMSRLTKNRKFSKVPFLLKVYHQRSELVYDASINTIVTRSLLAALMRGTIRNPEEVCQWLDRYQSTQISHAD